MILHASNRSRRAYTAGMMAIVSMVLGLTACGEDEAVANDLVILDVSRSSIKAGTNLVPEAQAGTIALVEDMTPGSRVTVVAFNNRPGSPCEPLVFDFPEQGNSEQEKELKAQLLARLDKHFISYVDCVTSDEYGSSDAGSSIFGSIPVALVEANASDREITKIHMNTDSCTFKEGPGTCTKAMSEPGFARSVVTALPASLKPDLANVDLLVVHGLGQGTSLQSADIAVLQEIWTLYADATNTRVTFV